MMNTLRDPKRRPTHPGAILREDVLPSLNMTQTSFAICLGVSRVTLSDILHERRAVTPGMALRLEKLLGTSAESWLRMQEAVDLWEARKDKKMLVDVKPLNMKSIELCSA